jgi:hypothetical protein
MVVGATSPSGARFVAKVENGPVRIAVADNEAMTGPTMFGPAAVDGDGVAKVAATGLDADTAYWWQVEDNSVLDTSATGRFHTHPTVGSRASFTIAVSACAGAGPVAPGVDGGELAADRVSNHAVFDRIREHDPLMFVHLGDLHYYDLGSDSHGITGGASLANYRRSYDDVLAQPRQHQLYREVPLAYVWDDHDWGPDNSDGTHPGGPAAQVAYAERMPHMDLDAPAAGGMLLTGATGAGASTPDHASLRITGDLELAAVITPDTWAGVVGRAQHIAGRWFFTGDQRSYRILLLAAADGGALRLQWTTDGTGGTVVNASPTVPLPVTSGQLAIRATLDVDTGSGREVTFYTGSSIDGPWTQLGDPVTGAATSIHAGTAALTVGGIEGTFGNDMFEGSIARARVRAGIGGTIVADPDFAGQPSGTTSFDDAAGRTWTVAGNAEIVGPFGPIYHAWKLGRVLFVASDTRSRRTPNAATDDSSKTMLGAAQKAWLENLLSTSAAELLVWLMPTPWLSPGGDSWGVFTSERAELVAMLDTHGWLGRMLMVHGDRHALGIGSGALNDFGGFPILQAASLDSGPSAPLTEERFDIGPDTPGRGQWGTVTVEDLGPVIRVTLAGWQGDTLWAEYQFAVAATGTTSATVQELAPVVSGSHTPIFEARVLPTAGALGPDPDGVELSIVDGHVSMDGTADIQRTLDLTTEGLPFPRRIGDVLLPDGTEVFVRRGVDIGSTVLWVPLGYFRVQAAARPGDHPRGAIRLAGMDRMVGIVDAELLAPQQFDATRTFGFVFAQLVHPVYPAAVILFDDELETEEIGRPLVVERSRYEPLRTLAQGRGKILYWDGEGVLRIESAPDPDDPVWEVRAGRGGVLVAAQEEVTRDDVRNAVVVTSQGGDALAPARAVAIDDGPQSMTRFGGRFGQVPEHISTPAATTAEQAEQAARDTLLRRAGLPHRVSFEAVPNPALVPYDPVRVTLRDGTRQKHVIETLRLPLTATGGALQCRTREQRLSQIRVVDL